MVSGFESIQLATIILIVVAGFSAGWVDAVVGGGGLLQLPALLLVPGITPVQALATNKMGSMDVKDGMIHDWTAAIVVPGATVEKTLAVLQNYDEYKNIYRGDVTESKLLRPRGLWIRER